MSSVPDLPDDVVPDVVVGGIRFEDDGSLMIDYVQPAHDIKANKVQLQHTIFVPADDDYDEEITSVRDAVVYLVRDVLEDLPHLPGIRRRAHQHTTDDED